jgi:hypothetical protein
MANKISETTTILVQTIIMIVLLFSIGMLLQGCTDKCEVTSTYDYQYFEPVYTSLSEIRSSVAFQEPEALNNTGKIYIIGNSILINELGKGIHVIDNYNPASPKIEGFINIPGNYDMAVRDKILYADSYMDLLAIDISDINNIQILNRIENVIYSNSSMGFDVVTEMGVITDWQVVSTVSKIESECNSLPGYFMYADGYLARPEANFRNMAMESNSFASSPVGNNTGIGGSMARFTINEQFLYTIDHSNMNVFNITDPENPTLDININIGWGIETIFPYRNNLFIGAQDGMHIYSLSTPSNPSYISTFSHVTSCDPVVVEGDYAYVTLRSGSECMGFTNQLDVLDIKDLTTPTLVKSYPMVNPHGLGISEDILFVCEGEFGLKIFNAEDKENIDENMLAHFSDLHAYDVIPYGKNLIMIGRDGLYQYNFEDIENIKLLSFIPVTPLSQ